MEIEISFGFAVRENELQSARGCPEDRAAMGKLAAPSGVGETTLCVRIRYLFGNSSRLIYVLGRFVSRFKVGLALSSPPTVGR